MAPDKAAFASPNMAPPNNFSRSLLATYRISEKKRVQTASEIPGTFSITRILLPKFTQRCLGPQIMAFPRQLSSVERAIAQPSLRLHYIVDTSRLRLHFV